MPYVPSKKTDGKSTDREIIDAIVEVVAKETAGRITNNFSLISEYKRVFLGVAYALKHLVAGEKIKSDATSSLAKAIYEVGEKYGYEGAFLGEMNYALTRFIQRVPGIKVQNGDWKEELRYWLYDGTVEALMCVAIKTLGWGIGVGGIFVDVKDEYKRRVNPAYEAEQIVKSGDCYDTPYYTRLVEVVDEKGKHIGYQEVMLKRSEATVDKDLLDGCIVLKKKK